jgi:hypothetical protein
LRSAVEQTAEAHNGKAPHRRACRLKRINGQRNLRLKPADTLLILDKASVRQLAKGRNLADAVLNKRDHKISAGVGVANKAQAGLLGEELPAIKRLIGEAAGGSHIDANYRHRADQDHGKCGDGKARCPAPEQRGGKPRQGTAKALQARLGASVGVASDSLNLAAAAGKPLLKRGRQSGGRLATDCGGGAQHRLKLGRVGRVAPKALVDTRAGAHIGECLIENRCNIGAHRLISCRGIEWHRRQLSEGGSVRCRSAKRGKVIDLVVQNALKALDSPVLKGLNGPLGAPQDACDLAVAHIGEEAQRQYLLLIFCELPDRLLERHAVGDHTRVILAALINKILLEVERCRAESPSALVAVEDV